MLVTFGTYQVVLLLPFTSSPKLPQHGRVFVLAVATCEPVVFPIGILEPEVSLREQHCKDEGAVHGFNSSKTPSLV